MIVKAHERMLPALKSLWAECFGDEAAYVDFYFENRFSPDEMFVKLDEDGAPGAMLSMLPCEMLLDGVYHPAQYVYAVATRPDLRGGGVSTALLEFATERLARQGRSISLLVPAEESLSAFYEKRGFHSAFSLKSVELSAEELAQANPTGFTLNSITPRMYARLRDAFFAREGYVRWDERAILYAMQENEFHGGSAYKITSKYGQGVVLCTKMKDRLFVRELGVPDEGVTDACAALCRRMRCTSALLRLPAASALGGQARAYGMASETAREFPGGGYLNLALD